MICFLIYGEQTEDKIYLILEYCTGGDLAAYIRCHGRVSEGVARHFMRQLGISRIRLVSISCIW